MFTIYTAYTEANQKVVVINPGHSIGYDSGATSAYKSEAQVNQEVAGRVVRKLADMGYKVYITHTTDDSLAGYRLLDQSAGSYLKSVGSATNSVNPDIALSIHHNSAGRSSTGTELYWSSYRSFDSDGVYTQPNMWANGSGAYRDSSPCAAAVASKEFANIIKENLAGMPNLPFRKIEERDDYLPAHATCPCVLYEGGFLSNPSEAAYLASDAYQEEASTRLANAIDQFLGGSNYTPDNEAPTINSVTASATETTSATFSIEANVTDNVGVSKVRFATWTEDYGQDDIVWQDATNNGNNSWSATIDAKDHNYEAGTYITHIYAYDARGNFSAVAAPYVVIKAPSNLETGLVVEKLDSNIAVALANNLGSDGYKFAVWSEEGGQDDLIWADGEKQIGDSYKHVINRVDHGNSAGNYIVHCYTQNMEFVGGNEIDFGRVSADSLTARQEGNNLRIEMTNVQAPYGISNVRFAVWSEVNGMDDLNWYNANYSNGTYSYDVNLSRHIGNGTYIVHAYLNDRYNYPQLIGGTSTVVNGGSASQVDPSTVQVNIGAQSGNTFTVTVSNVPDGFTTLVPVWSDIDGQDDIVWYTASGNTATATVNLANHRGSGLYHVHVYVDNGQGSIAIGAFTTEVTNTATVAPTTVTGDTPIMGNSGTSAAQLVNLYNEHSPVAFPDYYIARGVSLGQFAQFYIEECAAENVRADVAFSQAMLETGFLGFGGDVSISQFNFAGLGATGGGVRGEDFAAKYGDNANGIRMGIRAQIQHLKAYASTDPLNNECVDTRFGLVTRGRAATINGLTGTWAADKSYAPKIVTIINYIK